MSYNEAELQKLDSNLTSLYNEIDTISQTRDTKLLNYNGTQTNFGNLLSETLKLITKGCDNYITKLFNNNTGLFISGFGCSNKESISTYYNNANKLLDNVKTTDEIKIYRKTALLHLLTNNSIGNFKNRIGNNSISRVLLNKHQGGNRKTTTVKKINKKTILGKERCIYAIQGDRKEYLRYKGNLIPVKDYKKLMKDKK
jgi:hypothetical protein